MTGMIPAPQAPSPRQFEALIGDALRHRNKIHMTPDFALKSGVNVYALARYAAGVSDQEERQAVQGDLVRLPWCMRVVTALVKAARVEGDARDLLESARTGAHEKLGEDELTALLEEVRRQVA